MQGVPVQPRDEASDVETAGDDSLVAKGFRRSIGVVAVLGLVIAGFFALRDAPVSTPGSAAPADAPLAPRSEGFVAPDAVAFRDVARAAGVDFVHESGARGDKLLPECLGGGVAVVDLDGDGLSDLVFTQGQPLEPATHDQASGHGGIRVYRNRTQAGGALAFEHVKALDDVLLDCDATGLAVGDLNADGREDIYVASVRRDRLLLNTTQANGAIALVDATDAWGVGDEHEWGTSAGMFDADGDGDLDIVVANYVKWSPTIDAAVHYTLDGTTRAYGPPTGFDGSFITLLQNEGGKLRDVTSVSGVDIRNPVSGAPYAKALGLVFADTDGDGRVDILVANDKTPKFLLKNLGPSPEGTPRFADVASAEGFAYDRDGSATGAMGIDATWLRDGTELGIAIGNFANEPSSLYLRADNAKGMSDEALGQGFGAPTRRMLTFGTLFVDVDLDGDEDIVQANGHLEPDINRYAPSQTYAQRGQLFLNRGGDHVPLFVEAPAERIGDLAKPAVGRALAAGDLDRDGDTDLVLVDLGGPARVLVNEQNTGNHWIRVVPAKRVGVPAAAVGTEVAVSWKEGADNTLAQRRARRIYSPTRSYLTQCAGEVIVGIGRAKEAQLVEMTAGGAKLHTREGVPAGSTVEW